MSVFYFGSKLIGTSKCKGVDYDVTYISRSQSEKPLRLAVYKPEGCTKDLPVVLWIHGGGYAFGVPEHDECFINRFVLNCNCIVVSPDYTLSTEAPYPAALHDCYDALKWVKNNAAELMIKDDQIFVGSESAGGGLTAALCIYARDLGEVSIAFQMPLYPMLDDRTATDDPKVAKEVVWNGKSNQNAWELYLGELFKKDNITPYASPARLRDFVGLPPAFTYVGTVDLFHNETVDYINNLKRANIAANYHIFEGCYHGFEIFNQNSSNGKQAFELLEKNLNYATKNYFAKQESKTE